MQQYHLTLKAHQRPETLERILRVVRHRGFALCTLSAEIQQKELVLSLVVQSSRELSLLVTQLEKLIDIVEVDYNQ